MLNYYIVRSGRRKTSEIIVDAENVIVRTPYNKSIEEINDIVREKANWIGTKQSEYRRASPGGCKTCISRRVNSSIPGSELSF